MCSGGDILKVAALGALAYATGGFGLAAAGEGAAVSAGLDAAIGGASGLGAAEAGATVLAGGTAAAGAAAEGGTALTGANIMAGLKTAGQFAPLASLAMAASQPKLPAMGVPSPTAPPTSQAATTPAQSVFKKKLAGVNPTALAGSAGVDSASLTLGRATVLGS